MNEHTQDSDDTAGRFSPRIEAIETQWSMVRKAHHDSINSAEDAKKHLVMRYSSAIRGYIQAITKNADDVDEISQDVFVRILNGDFAGADPDRGRFRDLLKVAVRNMVRNFWAKQNRRRHPELQEDAIEAVENDNIEDDPWSINWRNNLLEITWQSLRQFEEERKNSVAFTVLRIRTQNPNADSKQLAELLSQKTGRTFTAPATRQQLHRARIRFAELLVEEIAQGLDVAEPDRIQEELISLGLYERIRDVLPEQWATMKK